MHPVVRAHYSAQIASLPVGLAGALSSLLLVASVAPLAAEPAHRVTAGPDTPTAFYVPRLVELGDAVIFEPTSLITSEGQSLTAYPGEVWRSDGTADGTRPFLDARSIAADRAWFDGLLDGVALDGGLLFLANVPGLGLELWQSDLTLTGTRPMAGDLLPPALPGIPSRMLTRVGDHVLFLHASAGERRLWSSDGTAAGAEVVGPSREWEVLGRRGDRVLLARQGREAGARWELWISDGTASGTAAVGATVAPWPFLKAARVGGVAYFLGSDDAFGLEIWSTDGTAGGTVRRTTGFLSDEDTVASLIPWNGRIWITVFPAAGGQRIYSLGASGSVRPEPALEVEAFHSVVAGLEEALLVVASDGDRTRLLAYDGSTLEVLAEVPNSDGFELLGRWFFRLGTPPDEELWITDGSVAGTGRWSPARDFTVTALGDQVVQASREGLYAGPPTIGGATFRSALAAQPLGQQPKLAVPWGDGVAYVSPTLDLEQVRVAEAEPETDRAFGDPQPAAIEDLLALGDRLLVAAGGRLTALDASGDTAFDRAICDTGQDMRLEPLPGHALVACSAGEVWITDGTLAGTRALADTGLDALVVEPCEGTPCKSHGFHGPRQVVSLSDDPGSPLAVFSSDSRFEASALWVTDGTPAGTFPLRELTVGDAFPGFATDAMPRETTRLGDQALFVAFVQGGGGWGLWATDGTVAGTRLLRGFGHPDRLPAIHGLQRVGERILFFERTGDGSVLWSSDGSVNGTGSVIPLRHQGAPVTVVELDAGGAAVVGGQLYFVAWSLAAGEELWRSDGTAGGTRLVADLVRGGAGSRPAELTAVDGTLLWSAATTGSGRELWTLVGGSPRLVQELAPGPGSSWPHDFTAVGEQLFFVASTREDGEQLWAIADLGDLTGEPDCDGPVHCFQDGRFRVAVTWDDDRTTGAAKPVPGASDDSGLFTFFSADNWEMLVKALDGCAIDGHYWVFAAAATNVGYELEVTDLETGERRVYTKAFGPPAPALTDTGAFACSP